MNRHPLIAVPIDLDQPVSAYENAARLLGTLYASVPEATVLPVTANLSAVHAARLEEYRAGVAALNFPGGQAMRRVTPKRLTSKALAERLGTFAEDLEADLFMVTSHGRGPVQATVRGSVTQHLLTASPCPILSINPHFRLEDRYSRLLLTTDLHALPQAHFDAVVRYARDWAVSLTLYNKLEYIGPSNAEKYESEPAFRQQRDADLDARRRAADELALRFTSAGVETDVVIDTSDKLTVPAISAMAAAHPGTIVAVTSRHGPLTAGFTGSVTRPLMRSLGVPTLIFPSAG